MAVIVTGASGPLGRAVTEHLRERLGAEELILVTRNPEALREIQPGTTVRFGDFSEPSGLPAAFSGGSRLLLISTDAFGTRVAQHTAAIEAAVEAGVEFVTYTSFVAPDRAKPRETPDEHTPTERALRESGLSWCILRNSVYAESEAPTLAMVRSTGKLVTNYGDGRVGYVARDDCAAAAAAVLTSTDHDGKTYDVTGPEALDSQARAEMYSELIGRPVELVNLGGPTEDVGGSDDVAAALAEIAGLPLPAAKMFASFGEAVRAGWLDLVSSAVEDLTGRPPRSLREFMAEMALQQELNPS